MMDNSMDTARGPNWRHVGAFLGLTFGVTWLLNLAIYLRGGLAAPGIVTILQLQMLLPASCAIVLGLFAFPESPIYRGRQAGPGRWFYVYFLALAAIYVLAALAGLLVPAQGATATLIALVPQLLSFLGLVVLGVLRLTAGREAMARVGLTWGNWRYWLLFGLPIVAFYTLQMALNGVLGLGGTTVAPPPAGVALSPSAFWLLAAVQSVLLGPFLGIIVTFGEEYGWRGYLQSELVKLGRVRGMLLLGVIWGAWHWPLILMGYNYPGHPLLGVVLMTGYTTGLAFVLGYAVLRTRSVLLSSYLHALNNQVLGFLVAIGFRPHDAAFSFGIGIYALATLAIVVYLILRDPIWRNQDGGLAANEQLSRQIMERRGGEYLAVGELLQSGREDLEQRDAGTVGD